jgi:hypothetical protein
MENSVRRNLLAVDAAINLILGGALVVFPERLVTLLGVPAAEPAFYPSVLGGVLVGVGGALLIARSRPPVSHAGLGLAGAVTINLCGGVVLGWWMLFGELGLPLRGQIVLCGLVIALVGLSGFELVHQVRQPRDEG